MLQGNLVGQSQPSTAFKITQVGPVNGSNVIVSRMDNGNTAPRPTSSSPIPTSGPLANSPAYYYKPSTTATGTRGTTSSGPGSTNFYHNTANNVTKFTNMTVANAGAKNPLKPSHHYPTGQQSTSTSSNTSGNAPSGTTNKTSSIVSMATHPNANLSAPNTSGMAPKTTLKASDLIHILPNLFNTLKRRNSNSGISVTGNGASGSVNKSANSTSYFNGNSTNSLAAAVAAAASNSGKPLTTSTAAALVAEQLLNVAASGPFSDDSSPSPPPQNSSSTQSVKRLKLSDPNALQCEICGKVYKHRNCLSKHMWEHHESWEHTKKVCQTKHQQVQLLEAAQVLTEIISGVVRKDSSGSHHQSRSSYNRNNGGSGSGSSDYDEPDEYENENEDEISTTKKLKEMEIIESWAGEDDDNISIG